jgi:hypothetical protein
VCEERKLSWKKAKGRHEGDRLETLGNARQIVDGLLPLP